MAGAASGAIALGQENVKPDFTLRIGPIHVEVQPGKVVKTTGYNGAAPGPLIRCKEGQTITIEVVNGTASAELAHWHGLRAPSAVDGAMEEGTPMIAPGTIGALHVRRYAGRHALVSQPHHGGTQSRPRHLHRAVRLLLHRSGASIPEATTRRSFWR